MMHSQSENDIFFLHHNSYASLLALYPSEWLIPASPSPTQCPANQQLLSLSVFAEDPLQPHSN